MALLPRRCVLPPCRLIHSPSAAPLLIHSRPSSHSQVLLIHPAASEDRIWRAFRECIDLSAEVSEEQSQAELPMHGEQGITAGIFVTVIEVNATSPHGVAPSRLSSSSAAAAAQSPLSFTAPRFTPSFSFTAPRLPFFSFTAPRRHLLLLIHSPPPPSHSQVHGLLGVTLSAETTKQALSSLGDDKRRPGSKEGGSPAKAEPPARPSMLSRADSHRGLRRDLLIDEWVQVRPDCQSGLRAGSPCASRA